ncbi:MAG: hypothetical protein H6670_03790 [Anaerolineaceae bacterium]|nr:hypothetical protein [Anaerolineaceae bacterium]
MKKLAFIVSASLLSLLASACLLTNPVFTITCTAVNITADYGEATVDNTGTGLEVVYVRAYDGYNNQILNIENTFGVGNSITNIDDIFTFTSAPQANPIRFELFSPAGADLPNDTIWYSATGICNGLPDASATNIRTFADGRINNRDAAAPFAVYENAGTYSFYWINDSGEGVLILTVTADDIAQVSESPEENTVIASNEAYGLYFLRLTDGPLQAQAHMSSNGKLYVLIIRDVVAGIYESYEVEP